MWKLLVRFFVPEVKPWAANQIPINVHQTNGVVYSDKKEPCPKAQVSHSEAQVPTKRRQVSAGSSHRARLPDPTRRSLLRQPGTQTQAGPQAPQAANTVKVRSCTLQLRQTAAAIRAQRPGWGEVRSCMLQTAPAIRAQRPGWGEVMSYTLQTAPAIRAQRPGWGEVRSCMLQLRQMAAAIRAQRLGWGRGSLPPEGLGPTGRQPWQGLCSPAGHSPRPVPQPEAERAGGLGEQDRIHHFSPSSPDNHHSDAHWLNEPLTCAH